MLLKSILPLAYLATTFAQQPYLNIDDEGNFVDSSDSKWIDGLTLNKVLNRAEKLPDTANEIEFEKGPKGLLRSSAGNEAAVQLRKFRYQFIMAFWVRYHGNLDKLSQKWEDFKSRITNYGCFCFNESNAAGGKGQARDLIDQSCKNLFKCQTCIKMDIDNRNILPNTDGSCSITTTYNFNLTKSAVTELPEIECQNLEGTCKRALCECDKRFANELAHSYDTWDSQLTRVHKILSFSRVNFPHFLFLFFLRLVS